VVNVLSGAPYGYRYVRKTETTAAYYEILEGEAAIVRQVFTRYTVRDQSINAIARWLEEAHVPTRSGTARWERSKVWALLRNPAYAGQACYGKTALHPRQRIPRPLRQRGGSPSPTAANWERPRADWIAIPVPALVSEATFALAQDRLVQNKRFAPRRTIAPTLLQGMLVCRQCGYGLYRVSARTSKQPLYYYRCLGSDRYRHLKGPVCTHRPIRQDALDALVWTEVLRLLDDPALIDAEIARRRLAARSADPLRTRTAELQREQTRLDKSSERLLSAYQDGLATLEQLRQRMPELQKQSRAIAAELHALELATVDDARYLQLAETLSGFRANLRVRAETLDVHERQQILRLVVKEVLVDGDTITLRHSIPIRPTDAGANGLPPTGAGPLPAEPHPDYLLRMGRHHPTLRNACLSGGFQHLREQGQHIGIVDPPGHLGEQQIMPHAIEVATEIQIDDTGLALHDGFRHPVHCLMCGPLRPVPERPRLEVGLEDGLQEAFECALDYAIADGGNREDSDLAAILLRDRLPPTPQGPIRAGEQCVPELLEELLDAAGFDGVERDPVDPWGTVVRLRRRVRRAERLQLAHVDVQPPEAPGRFGLRLGVNPPLQVLQSNGRCCHGVPASPWPEEHEQSGPFAPAALPAFLATPDPSATVSSSAHFPGNSQL
jgi:site-specific DNA recombinase